MAINSYGGLPGAGKSYEIVAEVIIPQLAKGRNVVTNVEGLKLDLISEYIENKFKVSKEDQGKITVVEDSDIKRANFFCGDDPNKDSIVKYGDLVIVDEAWRYWGPEQTFKPEHFEFFTKHRHYASSITGIPCDLCLINQDPSTQLHRKLKSLVETTFIMKKHKVLGTSKYYRIDVFSGSEGIKTNPEKRTIDYQKKYDKEIFLLYSSYTGGTGTEKQIDRRQNIFAKKSYWYLAGILFIATGFSLYKAVSFFVPKSAPKKNISTVSNQTPQAPQANSLPAQISQPVVNPFSSSYKITGFMELSTRRYVIIDDGSRRSIPISMNYCTGRGIDMVCLWNKEIITYNSGIAFTTQKDKNKII